MESSPYDAPAGDQLTDGRVFEPLHPTLPKQYGTNSLGIRADRWGILASLRTEEAMIGGAILAFWALVTTGPGSEGNSPIFKNR
jgi:hypothetical protein